MMILVMLAALYIVIALAFEIVISRYYGIVQAAIEMSLIVLLPGFGFFLLLFLHLDIFLQHFTTFTPPRKLTKRVYTRPELSPLNFLRFGP